MVARNALNRTCLLAVVAVFALVGCKADKPGKPGQKKAQQDKPGTAAAPPAVQPVGVTPAPTQPVANAPKPQTAPTPAPTASPPAAPTTAPQPKAQPKPQPKAQPTPQPKAQPKPQAEPKPKPGEIVFDPRTPPAGYGNCHRNHCHRVGGGVASYQQVMQEMGATRIVGVPKPGPIPKAPADVAAPPATAQRTASGLASRVLRAGDGVNRPQATSVVTVHYTGWTTDGKAFDSSIARGRPATFPLNRVIPGWTEGLQLMSIGEERRLWIPQDLAYKGRPGRPAGMLVFDVELVKIR